MNSQTPPELFPKVRLIATPEEYQAAIAAARANNDNVQFPSHVVTRRGEIIGAVSLAVCPLVLLWHHSEKVSVRDSLHLKQVYNSIMETKGFNEYAIACNEHSNYNPHMQRLGFKPIWKTDLYLGGNLEQQQQQNQG